MRRRTPALGDKVRATISNISEPSGEEVIEGVVIDVLSEQFVVQAPNKDGTITRYNKGYRFVMNKDQWKVVA